ncbi:MAG: cytochrome c [Ignavibacteria bacterium]|nr:cytochrome c [Ignavibacteria bacterium]
MKDYYKYFGVIYILIIIEVIIMGQMYIRDLPTVTKEHIGGFPVVGSDTTGAATDIPLVKGTLSPPVDVMKYLNPTPEMIEKGKKLYTTTCASCHGDQGKGDGVAGGSLNPKPRNFHEMTGWQNGPQITMMYKTLQEGVPNTAMASYSNLSPEERLDLIMYIKTFNTGFPPVTQVLLDSIDQKYSLTKGIKMPNQIPVKLAMEKLLQQNMPIDQKIDSLVKVVKENKTDSSAVLFKGITVNLNKALTVLAQDSSWNNNGAALVKIFDNNPVQNGFKAGASYMLTSQQLTQLHAYLRKMFAGV